MKQKDILLLLVPSLLMVLAWVIFNIYHSSVSSTISDSLNMQIVPISPTFDQTTINSIKKRQQISPLYQIVNTPSISPTPLPSESPSPQATTSGSETGSPTATEGAQIQ